MSWWMPVEMMVAWVQELVQNIWKSNIILFFTSQDGVFQLLSSTVESGRLKCPFDPLQPFTSVLTGKMSHHTIFWQSSACLISCAPELYCFTAPLVYKQMMLFFNSPSCLTTFVFMYLLSRCKRWSNFIWQKILNKNCLSLFHMFVSWNLFSVCFYKWGH